MRCIPILLILVYIKLTLGGNHIANFAQPTPVLIYELLPNSSSKDSGYLDLICRLFLAPAQPIKNVYW